MSDVKENLFESGVRALLYAIVVLIPLLLVPGKSLGIDFGREVMFEMLAIVAGGLLLLSVLTRAELRYPRTWIFYSAALVVLVLALSTLYSKAPFVSLLFAPPVAERLSTLLFGLLIMAVTSIAVRSREQAGTLLELFFASATLSGLITLIQFISGFSVYKIFGSNFGQTIDFNVIGTVNGLALFYSAVLMAELAVLFFSGVRMRKWAQYFIACSSIILLANILLINFGTSWILIFGSGVFLLGILLKNTKFNSEEIAAKESMQSRSPAARLGWRYPLVLFLLALSIFMIVEKRSFVTLNVPAEVAPTLGTTVKIGQSVFKQGILPTLLGTGPGTFGLDWIHYKDSSINNTVFWNVRFNQGASWISTLLPTAGILGALLFVVFLLACLFTFLKTILLSEEEMPLREGAFMAILSLCGAAFFYPANLTLLFTLFILIGLEIALIKKPVTRYAVFAESESMTFNPSDDTGEGEEPKDLRMGIQNDEIGEIREETSEFIAQSGDESNGVLGRGDIRERLIEFTSPWAMFLSSLLVVFLLFFGFWVFYFEVGRVQAAVLQQAGVSALQRGDVDTATQKFQEAISHDSKNPQAYQMAAEAQTEKVRTLIQRAAQGKDVQQEFQNAVVVASQSAKTATDLFPQEPSVWRTQGALYELIIPYIDGAENLAVANYQRAADLDPLNPSAYLDIARAGLVFTDRIRLVASQAKPEQRDQLQKLYTDTLQQTEQVLQKAVDRKPDLAEAHFALAQVALRLGNIQSAIKSVENAKRAAPLEIGVAFQLGLLYYQSNDLEHARGEFERAVSINSDYSNARYFLGLIYDRGGDKAHAIEQFAVIEKLNPDNAEVKHILENLRNNKSALDGISPPQAPPEKRDQAPVKETKQLKK